MPLPLAMMIPFMGIQSAVMAKQFGENFQFGKRRISAMSNEEFNATTPLDLLKQNTAEIKSMIPTMEESITNMRTFQTFLIREFLQTLNDAIKAGFGQLFGLSPDDTASIEHFLHGHPVGHEDTSTTETEDPLIGGTPTTTEPLPPIEPEVNPEGEIEGPPEGPMSKPENAQAIADPISYAQGRIQPSGTSGFNVYTNIQPDSGTPKWLLLLNSVSISDAISDSKFTWPIATYFRYRPNGDGTYPLFIILDRSL